MCLCVDSPLTCIHTNTEMCMHTGLISTPTVRDIHIVSLLLFMAVSATRLSIKRASKQPSKFTGLLRQGFCSDSRRESQLISPIFFSYSGAVLFDGYFPWLEKPSHMQISDWSIKNRGGHLPTQLASYICEKSRRGARK